MTTIESFATSVGIAAGAGAFLDFYVGKKGQKSIRDWLETMWVKMSYMTINDVVRAESNVAARMLSRVFGVRLFSARKVFALSIFFLLLLALTLINVAFRTRSINLGDYLGPYFGVPFFEYVAYLITTCISISLSLAVAQRIAKAQFSTIWSGTASAFALLLTQALLTLSPYAVEANAPGGWATPIHKYLKLMLSRAYPFAYESAVPGVVNYTVDLLLLPLNMIWGMVLVITKLEAWHYLPRCGYLTHIDITPYVFWSSGLALNCAEYSINLIRLIIFCLFALTFALFPFRNVFSTVWLRIIESDKPVFTLTLAGAAALTKLLQELAKLL